MKYILKFLILNCVLSSQILSYVTENKTLGETDSISGQRAAFNLVF